MALGFARVVAAVKDIALGNDARAPTWQGFRLSMPSISYTRSRSRTGHRSPPRGRTRSFVEHVSKVAIFGTISFAPAATPNSRSQQFAGGRKTDVAFGQLSYRLDNDDINAEPDLRVAGTRSVVGRVQLPDVRFEVALAEAQHTLGPDHRLCSFHNVGLRSGRERPV
jgi:hypothetical protein